MINQLTKGKGKDTIMEKWARIKYTPNLPLGENRTYVTASKEHIDLSCEAACEGMVLLKNEDDTLPIKKGSRVALFGKGVFDYVESRRFYALS